MAEIYYLDQFKSPEPPHDIRLAQEALVEIQELLSHFQEKRAGSWKEFTDLILRVKEDKNIQKHPSFQENLRQLCSTLDCRILGEEAWAALDEFDYMVQLYIRDLDEDGTTQESWDNEYFLNPRFLEIPVEEMGTLTLSHVLGFFVLIDRFIEFHVDYVRQAQYELTTFQFISTAAESHQGKKGRKH